MSYDRKPSDGPKCDTAVHSVLVMCLDVTRAADQWLAWWEVGLPRVVHTPNHRLHRAEVGVPTQPETDNFPSHSILLSRKGERDKGSTTNFAVSRRGEVDLRLPDEELIVFDLKLKLVVRVIPRAAEEKPIAVKSAIAWTKSSLMLSAPCMTRRISSPGRKWAPCYWFSAYFLRR